MTEQQQYKARREAFFASINSPTGQGARAADQVVSAHKAAYGAATTSVGEQIANTQKRSGGGGLQKVSKRRPTMMSKDFDTLMTKCQKLLDQGKYDEARSILGGRAMAHIQLHGWGR